MTIVQIISFGKKQETSNLLLKEYNLRNRKDFFKKDRAFRMPFLTKSFLKKGISSTFTRKLHIKGIGKCGRKCINQKDFKTQTQILLGEINANKIKAVNLDGNIQSYVIDLNDLYCLINNRMGWQLR